MICIRAANPIWYFVDLVGLGLNDQFYISFLTNTFPYMPQPIHQDVNCTIPWANPLQFFPNGTLPDNMYWNPDLVWRLEIRQGPTQSDPLIYEINNFSPGQGGVSPNDLTILTSENEITNPQFAQINFLSPLTITTAGTYDIGPGWQLILVGPGSSTVSQVIASGASIDVKPRDNSVPYALRIANTGWTTATLRQTLNHNGALWAGGAVGGVLAGNSEVTNETVTMQYNPSDGGMPEVILSALLKPGNFVEFSGVVDIPAPSTNNDLSTVAFVNIDIVLPATGIVNLSDIQLTGQNTPLPSTLTINQLPIYKEDTIERGIDHEFHYYLPKLEYKPIPSYLVGWDFPLNPAQFGTVIGPLNTGPNKSFYAWDQTIVFQSVTNGIQTSRVTSDFFSISASATTQAAIIQYLPLPMARELLDDPLSVYLDASALAPGPVPTSIPCTISLWATTDVSLPTITPGNSLVATLDANGKPATFNGNWTEIAPLNGQDATFNLTTLPEIFNGYWNNSPNVLSQTATFFAIVIGFGSITAANSIVFRNVGLQKGTIATRPSPQTPDEVLRECQFYFEKSYNPEVVAQTTTFTNASSVQMSSANTSIYGIDRPFKSVKYANPIILWISPQTGAVNNIYNNSTAADMGISSTLLYGKNSTGIPILTAPAADGSQLSAQWVASCLLGT